MLGQVLERLAGGQKVLGLPPVTFLFTCVLTLFFIVASLAPASTQVLALVPANTILAKYYIWNVVTGALYEKQFIKFCINAVSFVVIGKVLEPIWQWKKFTLFLCVVNGVTGIITCVLYTAVYLQTGKDNYLFQEHFGFSGVNAALIVGLKQEWSPSMPVFGAYDISLVPLFTTWMWMVGGYGGQFLNLACTQDIIAHHRQVVWLLFNTSAADFVFSLLSGAVGWVFLRFFAPNADGTVGDPAPDFAIAKLFPSAMQPMVGCIASCMHIALNCYGCLNLDTAAARPHRSAYSQLSTTGANRSEVAERRRQRALKALDKKLAQMADLPDIPLADLEDGLGTAEHPAATAPAATTASNEQVAASGFQDVSSTLADQPADEGKS